MSPSQLVWSLEKLLQHYLVKFSPEFLKVVFTNLGHLRWIYAGQNNIE